MRWLSVFVAIAFVVLASVPAAADYTTTAPVRPLTMSDPAGLTTIGLEFQLTRWTERPPPPLFERELTSLTFNIAADIALAPHWMILARLPVSDVGIDDADPTTGECCDLALGNLTIGGRGLWATLFESGTRAVAGGDLSVSLPTASDGSNRSQSASAAALAHLPHDPGLFAPNTTTIRFTALTQFYGRRWLAHAEAGLQVYFFDDVADGEDRIDVGIRLALAVGVRVTYKVAILAELNALFVDSNDFASGNDSVSSLDFGVRYGSGRGIFGARVYLPIDSGLRDLDMFGFGIDGGVRF